MKISSVIFIFTAVAGLVYSSTIEDVLNARGHLSKDYELSKCGSDVALSASKNNVPPTPHHQITPKAAAPLSSYLSEQEKKERMNESMARFMQLLTFFGHVDNFLTQKTHGLIRMMGRAVEEVDGGEDGDFRPRRVRVVKRYPPRITTTISS